MHVFSAGAAAVTLVTVTLLSLVDQVQVWLTRSLTDRLSD
jgi:hypothetical protein